MEHILNTAGIEARFFDFFALARGDSIFLFSLFSPSFRYLFEPQRRGIRIADAVRLASRKRAENEDS